MATIKTQIKLRRDTAANLANVVLVAGEPAYATDTKKFAIGDGTTKFSALKDYGFIPTIPNPSDYYWANVKVSTSSSTSTKPTFANNFLVNIATNNVLTPGADWAIASAISKYLWHDLLPFRSAKAEYSTDGTTWTEDTTDKYRRTLTNQKENQTLTVLSDSRPYARFTWDAGSAIWHACQADWLIIGFAYASPAATCSIKFQYSTDGVTWVDSLSVASSSYNSAPSWFKINNSFSSCRAVRLVLTRTNSSGTLNLSSVKWLTKRWGNQGMGSELEKPYSWDNNANLYYRNASSTLGLLDAPWSVIYGTTIYEGGTSLANKYQPKDGDLTAIAALTGTGLLKRTGDNTWALDTNGYLTSESDTLQTVTNRGATTNKAIEVAGLTTTKTLYVTGETGHREGIRIAPYNGTLSSIWWNASGTQDYSTGQMWGITAYLPTYSTDTSKQNTFRFRGPSSSTATSATDQMWINTAGLVTSRGGFAKDGSSDSYILLAGGGTKAVSDFSTTDTKVTQSNTTTANWRKVILSAQSDATAGTAVTEQTNQVYETPKVEVQPSTGSLRAAGTVQMNQLKITSTSMINHIEFARNSWNYIVASGGSSAAFGFVAGGKSASGANSTFAVLGDRVIPGQTDNKIDLGSSDYHFQDFYIKGKIYNGSYNYTLPSASGTLALTDQIPSLNNYVTLDTAQTISGKKTFSGGLAITKADENENMVYFLGIDAFASGGAVIWTNKSDIKLPYSQITGTPIIPTVNNGTLTIQRNGTTVATFTANQAGNTTANITDSDTLNTAGSTNDEAKLYLVGAKSQAASAQTYSDAEVYTQAGELNATTVCVAEHGQMKYDSTNQCIRFVIV